MQEEEELPPPGPLVVELTLFPKLPFAVVVVVHSWLFGLLPTSLVLEQRRTCYAKL